MKRAVLQILILLGIINVNISCEKDKESQSGRLRIAKIADNMAMENPMVFEYNSKNQLIRITSEKYELLTEIEYDSHSLPIKISTDNIGKRVTFIEWVNDGFVFTDNENQSKQDYIKYDLDSNGRIKKVTRSRYDIYNKSTCLSTNSMTWNGEVELNVEHSYNCTSGYTGNSELFLFKYDRFYNPFYGINLAVIIGADLILGEWETDYQNKYCVSEYKEKGLTAIVKYKLNDQNFPIVSDTKYGISEGGTHDYLYYEYESY